MQDKAMRLHGCGAMIENGQVFLPQEAAWLAEYVREMISFPKSKYKDQVDSTSQALSWILQCEIGPGMGFLHYARQQMADLERRTAGSTVND